MTDSVTSKWGLSSTPTLILSCQCAEGKHHWCWGCTPMVSRLSTDHVKHDNRIEAVLLFLKISLLNKPHNPPDKESAQKNILRIKYSLAFIHGRCTCGRSSVNLFSCHCRHSVDTYNILIKNVLVKNVKSDSKWEINFCSKQSVILSSLSASWPL